MEVDSDEKRKSVSHIISQFNNTNVGYDHTAQSTSSKAYKRRSVSSIAGLFNKKSDIGNQPNCAAYRSRTKETSQPPLALVREPFAHSNEHNRDNIKNDTTDVKDHGKSETHPHRVHCQNIKDKEIDEKEITADESSGENDDINEYDRKTGEMCHEKTNTQNIDRAYTEEDKISDNTTKAVTRQSSGCYSLLRVITQNMMNILSMIVQVISVITFQGLGLLGNLLKSRVPYMQSNHASTTTSAAYMQLKSDPGKKRTGKPRESKRKCEQRIPLSTLAIRYLQTCNFEKELVHSLRDVKIEFDEKQNQVIITATKANIHAALVNIYEIVEDLSVEAVQLSKPMCALMKQDNIQLYLSSQLLSNNCFAVYSVTNDIDVFIYTDVLVYAKHQDLSDAVNVIRNCILECTINVAEEVGKLFKTNAWTKYLKQNLQLEQEEIKFDFESSGNITVVATSTVYGKVLSGMHEFIKKFNEAEKLISLEGGVVELLLKEKKTELDQIKQDLQVTINGNSNNKQQGILVKGLEVNVTSAIEKIHELGSGVDCIKHRVNKDKLNNFLQDNTKCILHSLQWYYKVVVTLDDNDDLAATRQATENNIKTTLQLDGGEVINVVHGDLTNFKVEAIVNTSNPQLNLTQGLAVAIVNRGGNTIQKECTQFIQSVGQLQLGEVFISTAGKLPCHQVIHTVSPQWREGSS